jgi:hypothetical protein
MKAAVRDVGIPAAEAALLMAHLEFGARALVNTGKTPKPVPCPIGTNQFDARLAAQWNRMVEAEQLFDAVSRGDLALVRSLLPLQLVPHAVLMSHALCEFQRDPSCVRLRGPRGQILLHDAALVGAAELAATLLGSGADPDAGEAAGHTPLYRASTGEVARVLLAAGASADVTSGPTQGTPLHQAARHGSVAVVQALVDHGATIDALDAKGQTPLRRAVNCRQLPIVRILVRHGADPHLADRRGVTPIDVAHTDEMKQALADAGA